MRALIIALALIAVLPTVVSAQPNPPQNAQFTTSVAWDLLSATDCVAPCSYEVSVDGGVVPGMPVTVGTATFPRPTQPGLHVVTVVAIDGMMRRSAPSTIAYIETAGPAPPMLQPCTYSAPGSSIVEQRPIGQMIQGFNPIGASGTTGNQGDRIRQLKAWGWDVAVSQFVEGNLRPDKIDRLFLIVKCKGLTP